MKNQSLLLTDKFTRAVDCARILHVELRKGTEIPYMAHLLGVASLVMGEAGHVSFHVTEDMIVAALLHDAVEDHGGLPRLEDIRRNFGEDVARMVECLSDSFEGEGGQKKIWEERKDAYLKRLPTESPETQLISAADKLYNARTILDDYRHVGPKVWDRFKRRRREQLWYLQGLLSVFKSSGTNRIVEELERVAGELQRISAGEAVTR